MGRLIFFVAVLTIGYFLFKLLMTRDNSVRCSRCGGKGFWLGARGREKCDWCNGTGRLPGK